MLELTDYRLFYLFSLVIVAFSFVATLVLTPVIVNFAKRKKVVDDPSTQPHRKNQKKPVPLLGGASFVIIASLLSGLVCLANYFNLLDLDEIVGQVGWTSKILWILLAVLIMTIGGYFDDKYHLSPKYQVIFINLALIVAVFFGGLKVDDISEPFDKILPNTEWSAYFLSYAWLGFCIAATKFLDGHDGLVSTVGIIALLTIASVSWFDNVGEPLVFLLALIWAMAIAGFLPYNFPNAKVYLGEGGSEIIGFIVGVLAIFSGAKVATASTVIGYFIADLLFVWVLRLRQRRNPLTSGDRLHWHHRLTDLGLSKVQVLVLTALILLMTAHIGLWVPESARAKVLIVQAVFLVLIFGIVSFLPKKR